MKTKKKISDLEKFILNHELNNEQTLKNFQGSDFAIIQNEIECKHCKMRVYSAYRHDYRTCACGKVSVDGGQEYLKRSGDRKDYKELSIFIKEETLKKCLHEMFVCLFHRPKNLLGVLCAIMRTLRDCGELK